MKPLFLKHILFLIHRLNRSLCHNDSFSNEIQSNDYNDEKIILSEGATQLSMALDNEIQFLDTGRTEDVSKNTQISSEDDYDDQLEDSEIFNL